MSDAKFVISKDELTYQEVLDDFPNASSIYVLTFNISKKQTELLDSLRQCSDDTDICIVSNLPDRWAKYFGAKYAEKAKKNISIYKTKLDPEKISKKAAVYFCFSNHAKIIMTDNIVYVGSSNFSEESADNFESGFISKDLEFIEFLQNDVFPWVIESSSEYKTDEEILFIKTAIRKSVAMFEAMREKYFLAFYSLSDHRGVERWYYNTTDCILSLKDLESTKEMFQKYLELLDRTNRIFNISAFVEQGFENLDSVMEDVARIEENVKAIFDSTIEDLARFDDRDYVDEYLQECPDAYDENLDHYIEKAMSSASNVFAELAEDCKEDADDLLEQLEDIGKVAKEVMKRFDKLPLKEIVIDNT
jgi:hypothetical protein